MKLSKRAASVADSITLKLNEIAISLGEQGQHVYNLTSGQLPFKPMPEFIDKIQSELNFLKSYQYSPVPGFKDLRQKLLNYIAYSRELEPSALEDFDTVISNGSKQSIYNVLGSIIDPDDEVILLAPYWVSYPQMIEFWGGKIKVVDSKSFEGFIPSIEDVEAAITDKTKAIIINSPNNPAGIHYDQNWMKAFAGLIKQHPNLWILSDEVYSELYYFDPKPTYFYQYDNSLLDRTIIFHGISKSMACTGLRIGYCVAPKLICSSVRKIQGQTTSGASSLIQRSLNDFEIERVQDFLSPVKVQLRKCADILREAYRKAGLASCWYQSSSAFYFIVDFTRTPMFEKLGSPSEDISQRICEVLLEQKSIALVPSSDFGIPNAARLSLTLSEGPFQEAVDKLMEFLLAK